MFGDVEVIMERRRDVAKGEIAMWLPAKVERGSRDVACDVSPQPKVIVEISDTTFARQGQFHGLALGAHFPRRLDYSALL